MMQRGERESVVFDPELPCSAPLFAANAVRGHEGLQ